MLEAVLLFVLFVRGVGLCSSRSGFSSCVPVWRPVTSGEGQPAVEHLLLVAPCRLGPGVRRTAVRVDFVFSLFAACFLVRFPLCSAVCIPSARALFSCVCRRAAEAGRSQQRAHQRRAHQAQAGARSSQVGSAQHQCFKHQSVLIQEPVHAQHQKQEQQLLVIFNHGFWRCLDQAIVCGIFHSFSSKLLFNSYCLSCSLG